MYPNTGTGQRVRKMDSPVVVDTASKFGRGLDLDTSFPAFPFDDDEFPPRRDIYAQLDDFAARHPEFAEHLHGPSSWDDILHQGGLRNRRRGSGSGSSYQGHPDDDARSQASGSSAASGASGASGVSSHGEPELNHSQRQSHNNYETRRNPIPQYGLRNTVDIGQHQHNMENSDKGQRGQRSMSAPPENRQQNQPEQPASQQGQQPQRYVSRVDITPQHNQPQQQQPPMQQKPQQQQQQPQQKPQQQSNVRHIPIFVEGRDEPVIPKNVDDGSYRREPSPTPFHSSPHHFHRSSPFGQSFGARQHQWPPQFQEHFPQRETFYQPQSTFEQPTRRQQSQTFQQPRQQYSNRQQPAEPQPKPQPQKTQKTQPPQQQQQPQPQPQPQQQQPEPPKPKPALPKDALERVALVQKEVDSLAEQVKNYTGNSRKDKEYIYLDEMLTRELIKLDDIETEGRDNVRQARKNAIRSIQETISLLESKAPLPSQPQSSEEAEVQNDEAVHENEETAEVAKEEKMDVDQKQEDQSKEAIPLPSSPKKKTAEEAEAPAQQNETKSGSAEQAAKDEPMKENTEQQTQEQQQAQAQSAGEPMDTTPAKETESTPTAMEVQQNTVNSDSQGTVNGAKNEEVSNEKKPEDAVKGNESEAAAEEKKPEATVEEKNAETVAEDQPQQAAEQKSVDGQEKMEVECQAPAQAAASQTKSTPKKAKKSKKQAPVSDQPIPLPATENTEANAK